MKNLRISIYLVLAILASAGVFRMVQLRAQQPSVLPRPQQPMQSGPASDPQPSPPQTAVQPPGASAATQQDETEQRLGPFPIEGQKYTVVLRKKHLAQKGDVPAVDGVVSMEIVDHAGAALMHRSFPLWADEEAQAAWSVVAGTLSGMNGTGLVVRLGIDIDPSRADPDTDPWQYSQIFAVVDGKFMAIGGPIGVELGKPDADGRYHTAHALGSQADELPFPLCNGRFCFVVAVRIDWAQGKLMLAQQCAQTATAGAGGMCQYQMPDLRKYLRRPQEVTFVRLYSSPDENSGRPERVLVKPDSKIDLLTVAADVEIKQLDALTAAFGANDPVKDQMRIQLVPNTEAWLRVRVDGKQGWVHTGEDLAAIGLPEPEE